MKKLIIAIALLAATAASYAQGTLNFNNVVGTAVTARVMLPNGIDGAGAGYKAELLQVGANNVLTSLAITDFRTSSAAAMGRVNAVTVTTAVAAGANITVVMRAFKGDSYATSTERAITPSLTLATGGAGVPPGPATDLVGLNNGVNLVLQSVVVPEPTTLAFAAIGGIALLVASRRK